LEAERVVDVIIEIPPVRAEQAINGMRAAFLRPFGRGLFGRRIGTAAWAAFSAGLVHGAGLDTAMMMARTAAAERNARALLVARWSGRRVTASVAVAAAMAATVA
jgi:hypothetical protein